MAIMNGLRFMGGVLNSVQTYHIDILLGCFNNCTIRIVAKARKGDSTREHKKDFQQKQQSSVLKLFEMTKSTAAVRLRHRRITVT